MPAEPLLRGPGRPRGDSDLRARLLAAAEAAFASDGFDAASLRAIALAAGCDVSMVAHYFGSKAELWRAVIDALAERQRLGLVALTEALAALPADSRLRLRCGVEQLFNRIAADVALARMLLRETADAGPRASYIEARLTRPMLAVYRPLWEDAMRDGVLGSADVVVAHVATVGAISALIALRGTVVSLGALAGREADMAALRDEFCRGLFGRA